MRGRCCSEGLGVDRGVRGSMAERGEWVRGRVEKHNEDDLV